MCVCVCVCVCVRARACGVGVVTFIRVYNIIEQESWTSHDVHPILNIYPYLSLTHQYSHTYTHHFLSLPHTHQMRAVSVSIYSGIHMVGNGTQERIYSVNSLLDTGTHEHACVCVCKCVCVCVCVFIHPILMHKYTQARVYQTESWLQLDILVPSSTTQRKPFSSTLWTL